MSSCISGGLFGKDWCWGNVYRINVSIYESTRHLKCIDCYRDMGRDGLACLFSHSVKKKLASEGDFGKGKRQVFSWKALFWEEPRFSLFRSLFSQTCSKLVPKSDF
jgi:hypothetical protein